MMKKVIGLFILSFLFLSTTQAQQLIRGKVADANTGEPLPAAHIIVKGTYKGTIANEDGEYTLRVDELPATLTARFLGYETKEIIVTSYEDPVDFLLEEAFLEMEEITVTGEDPAISIMREVIRRKAVWRESLNTYQVDAYSRQQLLNDTSIVSISESVSQAFWDRELGNREVLKSRRQTANMDEEANFAGVSYLPNFYDDNLDIVEFDLRGVTHPDALKYYNFKLVDFSKIDDNIIFEIEVTPKRKLQPLFEGTIHVMDEEYAMISVRLKPNSVVVFPAPVQEFNMYYEQQFSNFGGEYWLPVDFRMEGLVEVGVPGLRFPPIGFKQVSKLNDYQVNIPLPDSLFENTDWISIDSTTIDRPDSIFVSTIDVVPLSKTEQEAYGTLDSTATLMEAFRPTGFMTRFIDWEEESDEDGTTISGSRNESGNSPLRNALRNFGIEGRYNRVDAVYAGINHERRYIDRRIRSRANIGYSTGYEELNHGLNLTWWPLPKTRRFAISGGYDFTTEIRYSSELFNKELLSVMPLFGSDDYFDYYRNEGGYLSVAFRPRRRRENIRFSYNLEEHSSINFSTSYDVFGASNIQRFNPPVQEGTLSSFELKIESGEGKEAMGVIGADNITISVEQSLTAIGSDWNFTKFGIDIYRRYNTFYKRRLIPNALDLRINAGTYLGDLPVQKNGVLDASLGYYTPFGAFRSKRVTPYEGANYFSIHGEHNFRSIPLEALGWRNAAKLGLSIIAFGGVGGTWLTDEQEDFFRNNSSFIYVPSTAENLHAEIGVSLSHIFSLFRVDFAFRIDEPGFYPGIALSRMF